MHLRGGGDGNDPYNMPRLQEWEKAEAIRKERKGFDQTVASSGSDDPERQKMIKYLLARSQVAKVAEEREVERKRLEEEEEAVDEIDQIIKREQEVEEFEELMLKEEEDMENEDYEERLRLWEEGRRLTLRMRAKDAARNGRNAFLVKTNYEGQFKDPEDEKAELMRLEEEIFQHFVAQMEAEDARAVEEERKRQRSEEADEDARKKFKSGASPGDSAMALSSDEQEDEHLVPPAAHLRGGASIDEIIAAAAETAGTPEDGEAERKRDAEAERKRKIDVDFQEMMAKMKALDAERDARVKRAGNRASRQKAVRTSGYARDEEFEQMVARMEAEDCERLEAKQRHTEEVQRTSTEEAAREISATEEVQRRTESVAERCYLLPPESPPRRPPPSYEQSEMEAFLRGGEASPPDDDPKALLAELRSLRETVHLPEAQNNDTTQDSDDPRQMLAGFDRSSVSVRAAAAAYDDSRQMLAELATLSAPGHRDNRSPTNEDHEDDEDDDVSTLRARFERLRSSCERSAPLAPAFFEFDEGRAETVTPTLLQPEAVPYVVALALEYSRVSWEYARGWTTCLFSSGLDSYEAQKEKEVAVARAEEALQDIITSVIEVETENRRKAEETKLQCRLIVSNLAAGADEEEMERQFWKYRYDL